MQTCYPFSPFYVHATNTGRSQICHHRAQDSLASEVVSVPRVKESDFPVPLGTPILTGLASADMVLSGLDHERRRLFGKQIIFRKKIKPLCLCR
jgi:hypothetical protein